MTKELPSPKLLRKLLQYEPETGNLFWRERTPDMFPDCGRGGSKGACARWNARYAGKQAFTAKDGCGYRRGKIFQKSIYLHRAAWVISYDNWDFDEIDHINGNILDNRIKNLRAVSRCQNMKNAKMNSKNTSGYNGVFWNKKNKKWIAQIEVDKKRKYLGSFDDIRCALAARLEAQRGHDFTNRHGKEGKAK